MTLVELSEKQWQAQIVELARRLNWAVYRTFDSRRSQPGFPDLVLVRDRVVFVELKTERGKVSEEQGGWIDPRRGGQSSDRGPPGGPRVPAGPKGDPLDVRVRAQSSVAAGVGVVARIIVFE